jgi:hypothetical protein
VVLGAVGLMLFIMPILAIPISGCGAIVGLCGIAAGVARLRMDFRLSIAGVALCALALAIDLAIQYAPGGYLGRPDDPQMHVPDSGRRYVPPPARFRGEIAATYYGLV